MTDDRMRLLFGFALVVLLTILAGAIALGKVEEKTSYGLQFILGALVNLTGAFAQWCFSKKRDGE